MDLAVIARKEQIHIVGIANNFLVDNAVLLPVMVPEKSG
jgi:hypothetical protein